AGRAPPAPAGGPQPRSPWQRTLLPPAARRRIMGVIPPYGRGEQERHVVRSAAAGPPADPTNPGCDAVLGTAPRLSISVYTRRAHRGRWGTATAPAGRSSWHRRPTGRDTLNRRAN